MSNLVPRFCYLVWMETPHERFNDPDAVDVVRSQEVLQGCSSTLGGMFTAIRENEALINPPPNILPQS